MKTRSTSRLTSQHEKEIPRAHRASDSFLRAGPRTRSASHKLPTFQKSTSESSDLVLKKVVKNTFKTPEKDGITPERDGILPSFSGTEKLSQTTKITHKQTEENSQSLKDYGILPDNSVLGFTKPDDSFWWKHLDKSFQPSFQHTGEGILLGKDSQLGDSTIKNMSPLWYKHISSSLLATPAVRRVDGTVKNSSANISNEEESYESPPGDLAKKLFQNKRHTYANPFQKIMDTHDSSLEQTLHNSGGSAKKSNHGKKHKMSIKNNILLKEDENRNSSDTDISFKLPRPHKLFKGIKNKALVNKDLFRKALQDTMDSSEENNIDLQSRISVKTTKRLPDKDSDEDISIELQNPTRLFKRRKTKALINKDLFQMALQNTSNSPNDVVNDQQSTSTMPEPSAKHLSGSDISEGDISLKASRPNKLFKGRKAKTLVNKDLFQMALQSTSNSPNDAVNDLQSTSTMSEPSAKHLSGSDIIDEEISLKASRPNKLFKGRKAKTLVNKDLFQKALQNTTNSPNDAVNDLQSIIPEPSAKHLSGSDISEGDISFKASRSNKLFKGKQVKRLVNKDLFQKALQNTTNTPNDTVTELLRKADDTSSKHFLGSDISDDDIPLKALCPNKLFKGRKAKTLVNKDLFREALQITSNSPNNALNDQKSIIPEPSTKHLSGSDISEGDISIKASRPKKLFKGSKTQTLTNKDLFQKALQNTTKSSDDTIKNVEARKLTKSTQQSPNINKSAEEISLETLHQNTVFMERKTQTLVNKDLIRQNLQSSPMNSIDVINNAQSGPADKSTHHLNNSEKQLCDGNFTNSTKAVLYNKSLVPVIEKLSQNSIAMLTSASPAKRDTTHKISSENYAIDSEIIQSPLGSEKFKRYPRSSDPSLAALKNKKSLHLRKKLNFSKVNTSLDQSRTVDSTTSLIKPTTPKLNTKPPNSALQNDLSENKKELLQHSGGNNKMTITSSSVGHISNIDNAISIEKKRTPIKSGTSKVTLGNRNNENESGMVLNENSEHSKEFEMHLDANKKKTRNIVGDTSKRVEEKSRTLLNEQESRTSLNKSKELLHNIHSTKKSNKMDMVKNTKFSEDLTPYDNFSPHITKVMSSTRLTPSFSERETNQSQTANKVLQLSEHNAQTKVKINTIVSQENDTHNDLLEKSYLQSFPSNEKTMESPVRSLSSTKSKGKATHEGKTSLKNSEINSVLTDEVLSKLSMGSGQSNISKEDSVKVKSTSRSGENAKENFHYLSENVKQKSNAIKFSRTKKSSKHADELIGMDSGNTKNIDSFSELGDNELNAKSKRLGNSLKDIGKTMALLHGEEESSDSNREYTAHNQTSESVQKTRLSKTEALNRSPDLAAILTNVHKENSGIDDEQSLQFAKKDLISEKSLKPLEKPFKGTISHNSCDESIVVTKQIQKTYVFESSDHEESLKRLKKSLFIDNTNSVTSNKSLGTQLSTKHVRKALFADTDKLLQNVENFSLVHKNRENMDIDKESRESISLTISNSNKGNSGETLSPSQSTLLKRRAAIKAVIQRVKEKMARNICMDTEISNSTTTKQFPNYFSHALKINDLTTKPAVKKIEQKSVNPDFLVNGQVYRAPRLAKPARWVTPRLYNLLVKKCELKYGRLKARRKAEGFVLGLYEGVKIVLRRKSGLEMYVKRMQKDLFQLGIIESLHDFYQFVREYLPEQFRYKVVYCTRAFGKTSGIPYGPNTNIYAKLRFN